MSPCGSLPLRCAYVKVVPAKGKAFLYTEQYFPLSFVKSEGTIVLSKEKNDLVTQTNAGTPMGEMFRRYWLPALLSEELPAPDCPPVRLKLLGERLIAFRDSSGRLGVMDEFCAHRGVSLWFGRNEENGLRCPYHGWKFDVTGQCLEVPSEPEGSRFAEKIKLKSYPLIERGGVIWIYTVSYTHLRAHETLS
jgi:phthalate 4,5-dioxygenase oxygenase subunit